jgi:hypothetical protein
MDMTHTAFEVPTHTKTQFNVIRWSTDALGDAVALGWAAEVRRTISGTESKTMVVLQISQDIREIAAASWEEVRAGLTIRPGYKIFSMARQLTALDFGQVASTKESLSRELVDVLRQRHRDYVVNHRASVPVTSSQFGGIAHQRSDTEKEGHGGPIRMRSHFASRDDAREVMRAWRVALRQPDELGQLGNVDASDVEWILPDAVTSSVQIRRPLTTLKVPDGPTYPLRRLMIASIQELADGVRAWIEEVESTVPLEGHGQTPREAIGDLAANVHGLIEQHWRKPPHLLTDADRRVNRLVDSLIDWQRFDEQNPIERPLMGRIDRHLDGGKVEVFWITGPQHERDRTTVLSRKQVCRELRQLSASTWFYGSGLVFPRRIQWKTKPVAIPDPKDPVTIRQAWDLIPTKVVSDVLAWPKKKRGM